MPPLPTVSPAGCCSSVCFACLPTVQFCGAIQMQAGLLYFSVFMASGKPRCSCYTKDLKKRCSKQVSDTDPYTCSWHTDCKLFYPDTPGAVAQAERRLLPSREVRETSARQVAEQREQQGRAALAQAAQAARDRAAAAREAAQLRLALEASMRRGPGVVVIDDSDSGEEDEVLRRGMRPPPPPAPRARTASEEDALRHVAAFQAAEAAAAAARAHAPPARPITGAPYRAPLPVTARARTASEEDALRQVAAFQAAQEAEAAARARHGRATAAAAAAVPIVARGRDPLPPRSPWFPEPKPGYAQLPRAGTYHVKGHVSARDYYDTYGGNDALGDVCEINLDGTRRFLNYTKASKPMWSPCVHGDNPYMRARGTDCSSTSSCKYDIVDSTLVDDDDDDDGGGAGAGAGTGAGSGASRAAHGRVSSSPSAAPRSMSPGARAALALALAMEREGRGGMPRRHKQRSRSKMLRRR